jgi:hypothetical protein
MTSDEQEAQILTALDEASERLYARLREVAARIMRANGEDASNEQLYRLRCVQVAYGINSRAQREWNQATTDADGNWRRSRTYRCTRHPVGEHDRTCVPPADPSNPELRLLRAIYGLCPDHDQCPPGAHDEDQET